MVHSLFNMSKIDKYICPHTYVKICYHKSYIYMCPHKFQRLIHMSKYVHLTWSHMSILYATNMFLVSKKITMCSRVLCTCKNNNRRINHQCKLKKSNRSKCISPQNGLDIVYLLQ